MKKTQWILLAAALASSTAAWGQSITVNSPATDHDWCIGSTLAITWTRSGVMQESVTIALRYAGSAPDAAPALVIATGEANDLEYGSWRIPDTVTPGSYFLRVRTDDATVRGDGPLFRIISCLQAHTPSVLMQKTLTMPVTFNTKMKYRTRGSWNCLQRMGLAAIPVPPNEFLVGFKNRCVDRGLTCANECLSQVYRASPIWDAVRLRTLVGKTLISATLKFRHKNTEANPSRGICLNNIYRYSGRMGEANPPPAISPPLPTVLSGNYRIDMTDQMRNWLREKDPSYHGELHNYHMEFVGCNERMDFNDQKCLSWFDSGSLEIIFLD